MNKEEPIKQTENKPIAERLAGANVNRTTSQPPVSKLTNNSNKADRKLKKSKTMLLVLVSIVAGFIGGWAGGQNNQLGLAPSSDTQQQIIASESQLINQIAKDVGPSVVSVNVSSTASTNSFFGSDSIAQQSAGTGVIISNDGVIMTNRHVIPATTKSVSVTLSDGTTFEDVEVIGRTNESDSLDVAFLKITDSKGKKLSPAKIADSSKVEVGDKVVAIGNALGQFQNTVTSGIISGYGRDVQASDGSGRSVETLQNLFQTDAAINQGNSGGPLVNTNSEVIALNTAVAGGDAQNIGFAIPMNDISGLIDSVLTEGKLLRPYLGVRYISLTDDIAVQYELDAKRGAYLAPANPGTATVLPDSPADKAGLQEEDIIVSVDDVKIDEKNSLTSILGRKSVGDEVTLKVIRGGEEISLKATLEAAPEE